MNETDVLVTEFEKKKVIINGKQFEIGKLSILQISKLIKSISKIILKGVERFKSIDTTQKNIFNDLMIIFEVLDTDEISEVISIVLNTDAEFCKNISAEDLTEIIAVVCEQNDFRKILKNVKRTAGTFREPDKK